MALANFQDPLFWTILLGWIASVVVHEFAHGLVAYWGGDYTIRERGGLSLNPIQYIDPIGSLLLPAVFLMLGGVPLPGGATYIRRDLLRGRLADALVSLAGPAANFILFILLILPFHPRFGLIDPASLTADDLNSGQVVLGTLALLQIIACIINLLPIPPLDGFQAISVLMDSETRQKFSSPRVTLFGMVILFAVVLEIPGIYQFIRFVADSVMTFMGFGETQIDFLGRAFLFALFGR